VAVVEQVKQTSNTTQRNVEGGIRPAMMQAKPVQPILDDQHRWMLDGKKEKVKGLDHIVVKYFPRGVQEITYVMDEDGKLEYFTTSEFQAKMRARAHKSSQEQEETGAKAFADKLFRRCLLTISADVDTVRAVQSSKFPKPAETMMGFSQDALKQRGLNTIDSVIAHWSKMNEDVKTKMDDFQAGINPDGEKSWSKVLGEMVDEHNQKVEDDAKRKAKKLALNAKPPYAKDESWGDAEGNTKANNPPPKTKEEVKGGQKPPDTSTKTVPIVPKRGLIGKIFGGTKAKSGQDPDEGMGEEEGTTAEATDTSQPPKV
jgi:hypothetical protein